MYDPTSRRFSFFYEMLKGRHLNVIVNYLHNNGFTIEKSTLKTRNQEEVLHKPISDLKGLLERIKTHNNNLYICALLTYGCLLRPHHEIRLLSWGDFSDDLSYITLSGKEAELNQSVIVSFLCLNMCVKSLVLAIETTTYFQGA